PGNDRPPRPAAGHRRLVHLWRDGRDVHGLVRRYLLQPLHHHDRIRRDADGFLSEAGRCSAAGIPRGSTRRNAAARADAGDLTRITMTPRQIRACVLALVLLAFVLRVGAIVALKSWRQPNAMEHRAIAMNIVSGEGFTFSDFNYYGPTSAQSPPYPYFLALLFKVFGADTPQAYIAAMVVNAMIGAMTV